MKKLNILAVLLLIGTYYSAQKTYNHIALLNATAHIGNGKIIEGSLIVINKDKIETVSQTKGLKLDYKSFDTVIDLAGKHIYPALINTNNVLGLHDAEAVRATIDFHEVGTLNPHIRSLIAYNTDNLIIPTVKTNGVLYTQATPRSGLISGSSSILALEGWNWEDAVLKADDGIHLNFPKAVVNKWSEDDGLSKAQNKKYTEEMNLLTKFFEDAIAYCKTTDNKEKNLRFEAMRNVLNGTANLYIHSDHAKDILKALQFVQKLAIKKPVIVGGKESYRITAELKKYKVPVMLNRVNDLPDYTDDNVDIIYSLPYLLQKDSVIFCLQLEGDMEAMQSRNLPFNAGESVAYGLTKEQALSSITLNAAIILGVDKLIGSLEEGKLASLVISEGDLLDIRTNNIFLAYISGKKVDLYNKQTELYNKYKNKYGIK
ncbi:amidohydrolase family protein [Aurantibacillus circumpalustris]|uniref:amidohydrolase family protein n=1 Tax=Aurantibacillus circumpalustris TaxID=3036359 RepID=UPI00295B6BE7|nr:amidohydrolase family protein [Aurantibacillus circumpalustris]